MGFSWSSAVAQETLLGIAADGGLTESCIWSPDRPLPESWNLGFAVATDDLMIFSDDGPGCTLRAAHAFERSLANHGGVKNAGKDINDSLSATCIGIDLVSGTEWWPPGARLMELLQGLADLCTIRHCSPGSVASYMVSTQWFCLLHRLRLSVFGEIYGFCSGSRALDWNIVEVPEAVLVELLLGAVLFPFGHVEMSKPFLLLLGATDASLTFGYGAAISSMDVASLRQVARLSAKAGEHVSLTGGVDIDNRSSRLGPRHKLGLSLSSFEVVLSIPVASPEHINVEEAKALFRYL